MKKLFSPFSFLLSTFVLKWGKSFAASAVLSLCVASAQIPFLTQPVYDWLSDVTRAAEFAREIEKIAEQIELAQDLYEEAKKTYSTVKENLDLDKLLAGNWRRALARLPGQYADNAIEVVEHIEALGWEVEDLEQFEDIGSAEEAIRALKNLQAVLRGRGDEAELRTTNEQIWGNVPATREGVKVEAAYQTLAIMAKNQKDTQGAIGEAYGNARAVEDAMNAGNVAPAEQERLKGRLAASDAKIKALQLESTGLTNQLMMHVLGMGASNVVRQQENQMRAKEELSNWFGAVKQGPKQRQSPPNDL